MLQNAVKLDSEIIYDRDFDYDYFGFKVRPSCTESPPLLRFYCNALLLILVSLGHCPGSC